MPPVNDLINKCEEFLKLAEDDENDLVRDPSLMADQKEQMKKAQTVRLLLGEIKKLCDIVDLKYRGTDKPGFFGKIFDSNYHLTMRDLKKARQSLENASKGLDKFSLF